MEGASQLHFQDWNSVNNTNKGEFIISNAMAGTQVWEITDPLNPVKMQTGMSGNEIRFVNNCNRLREYISFNPDNFLIPAAIGKILNQDLHHTSPADYIIITYSTYF